jgi:predicted nucleic acid-binding protein
LTAYCDTSFLVSLYTLDANSAAASTAISSLTGPYPLTSFCELEMTDAVELRVFRREITAASAKLILSAVQRDIADGFLRSVPTPAGVYGEALRLSRRHTASLGIRTLDVLHVAAALILGLTPSYTFDRRQRQLARAAGLTTPIRIP